MENDSLKTHIHDSSFFTFLNEAHPKTVQPQENSITNDENTTFPSSFMIELIHSIKNTLASIKSITLLSMEKFDDEQFRKYSYKSVTEDIKKIDSVLNSLLNYITISTPIIKTNTIHLILEGVLEANERQLQDKKIKVVKKFEDSLPEICIHDQQMKFIFDSILQYGILSTPPNGTIGFLIKSCDFQKGIASEKSATENKGGYVEIAIVFMGEKQTPVQSESVPGISASQREEAMSLILPLIKEIVEKNRGMMTIEADKKRTKTLITLRLPVEKRKLVYYEPITI